MSHLTKPKILRGGGHRTELTLTCMSGSPVVSSFIDSGIGLPSGPSSIDLGGANLTWYLHAWPVVVVWEYVRVCARARARARVRVRAWAGVGLEG